MKYALNIFFVAVLLAVSITDIRTKEIPDRYNLLIIALGLLKLGYMAVDVGWGDFVTNTMDCLCALVVVSLPLAVIATITNGAIGGGDIKLIGACGFYFGLRAVLYGSMVGFVLGGVYATVRLFMSGRQFRKQTAHSYFALGPFLCAGMIIAIVICDL